MSNSSLVTYKRISNKKNSPRNHKIDTITIHCYVGQVTAKQGCDMFANTPRDASCNYVVGYDGSIGLCVDEADRSWCSSSYSNDHRAITIEVASDTKEPYAVTEKAYQALINLCADICVRNGIKKLLWQGDKSLIGQVDKQNMSVHRWFANKSCPGTYLYERHGDIANKVNAILDGLNEPTEPKPTEPKPTGKYPACPFLVKTTGVNYFNSPSGQANGYANNGTYTIVEVIDNWGRLKSGVGWIYLPACTVVQKKTVEELAKEVIAGKWGNGKERKQRLTSAGYDYKAVQSKVNELLK